jgi:excisionase family DNA binding protein
MPRDDDWLSISEAAQVLDVSVSTLRAWSASGRIPCARTRGGHRRFSRLELRRWMADSPDPAPRRRTLLSIAPSPAAADLLLALMPEIASRAEMLLSDSVAGSGGSASARERRLAASSWVRVIADGLRAGDLRTARDRAVSHGWAMREAGIAAGVMTGGLIAIERAADDALAAHGEHVESSTADRIITVFQWLACVAIEAWATPTPVRISA